MSIMNSRILTDGFPKSEKFQVHEGAATNLRRPRATLARKVVPSFSMA